MLTKLEIRGATALDQVDFYCWDDVREQVCEPVLLIVENEIRDHIRVQLLEHTAERD